MGSFSTDGSTRMGSIATGLGGVFNDRNEDKFGFDAHYDDNWQVRLHFGASGKILSSAIVFLDKFFVA